MYDTSLATYTDLKCGELSKEINKINSSLSGKITSVNSSITQSVNDLSTYIDNQYW